MPPATQSEDGIHNRAERRGLNRAERQMRPALVPIAAAADHLGVGRSTLYTLLPDLESIKIGKRRLVTMESLDRLVERLIERQRAGG
jgi:hypothetical protein